VKRGEIWTATGGVYATKPWLVVIAQEDRFDATDSVTVLPMTTAPFRIRARVSWGYAGLGCICIAPDRYPRNDGAARSIFLSLQTTAEGGDAVL
jgi:hypothetical protein